MTSLMMVKQAELERKLKAMNNITGGGFLSAECVISFQAEGRF